MKIKKKDRLAVAATLTDEECLKTFLEFMETRVSLSTNFVQDPESGNLTHQVMQITCGEFVTISQPEPLEVVLRPATGLEQGATVN